MPTVSDKFKSADILGGGSSDSADMNAMFLSFCKLIFQYRSDVEFKKEGITPQLINEKLSDIIRNCLYQEQNVVINKSMKEVIYLMAAMADEIFLNMDWEGKTFWQNNILERKFFESQVAGEFIFRKIDALLQQRETFSLERAEIYLKALAMGFKGKFRDVNEEATKIEEYRRLLLETIERQDSSVRSRDPRIYSKEYNYTIPTITRKMLPDASLVNYLSLFYLFMFLTFTSLVWVFQTKDISRLLTEISTIVLRDN